MPARRPIRTASTDCSEPLSGSPAHHETRPLPGNGRVFCCERRLPGRGPIRVLPTAPQAKPQSRRTGPQRRRIASDCFRIMVTTCHPGTPCSAKHHNKTAATGSSRSECTEPMTLCKVAGMAAELRAEYLGAQPSARHETRQDPMQTAARQSNHLQRGVPGHDSQPGVFRLSGCTSGP
jgi:hypothetical protein